jgi:hypothetical protein
MSVVHIAGETGPIAQEWRRMHDIAQHGTAWRGKVAELAYHTRRDGTDINHLSILRRKSRSTPARHGRGNSLHGSG